MSLDNGDCMKRCIASMVLSGVGDALGYRRGNWEFNSSGAEIHKELERLGGLDKIIIHCPDWIVSDDTVMHLATAEALVEHGLSADMEALFMLIAKKYVECMADMSGRAPGTTCMSSCSKLKLDVPNGYQIPFNERHGGCGAAMRAMCIGLRYPRSTDLHHLIQVSIESGRMTHHAPIGYLGSLAAALFTHYAIQRKPVREWGAGLMHVLPLAWSYVESAGRYVDENRKHWNDFVERWEKYLDIRGVRDGKSDPKFPDGYDVDARDEFYTSLSLSGWGGACGHDSTMIAYDSLLGADGSWKELCLRGVLHGGDNDSTGSIAGAWFGAFYGFDGVPKCHYESLEYRNRLETLAVELFNLACQ